jgi:DNA-binding MarR family transcriptional regulator
VERAVWDGLARVRFHTVSELDKRLRLSHHISLNEFLILEALADGDGAGVRMSDLAAAAMTNAAALTPRVDKLERCGLVERFVDADDRRSHLVVLTPNGLSRLRAARVVQAAVIRKRFTGRLTRRQLVRMRTFFDEVVQAQ